MTAPARPEDLLRLLGAMRSARGRLSLGVAAGAGALMAGIGLTATAAWLIARAAEQPPVLALTVAVVAVRFFGVSRPVLRYVERLLCHDAALRATGDLRAAVFAGLVPLTPTRLAARRRGDLLAGVVSDVGAVEDLTLRVLEPVAVAAVVSATCVAVAAQILPSFGLVLLAAMVVAGVAAPVTSALASRRALAALAPRRAALSTAVVDLLEGAPDLIAVGAAERTLRSIDELDSLVTAVARRAAWSAGLGSAVGVGAAGTAVWGSAVVGASAVRSGDLRATLLAVVVLLPLAAFEALVPLPSAAVLLAHARRGARRLLALLDAEPAAADPSSPFPLPGPPYDLVLRDVRVGWPGGPAVLDGLCLSVPAGRHVAVIGESGSGKSTLAALLLRFLCAQSGQTLIAGCDVRRLSGDDVRRVVGLVADDAHIFGSDLRANLALALPGASDVQLVTALRDAFLGEWYDSLPQGLDTFLGEGGSRVSGGERRRIALARALLADSPVLVLDEPTEGLDEATAEGVMTDLLRSARGRTVLLLTHRTEGLDLVDEVLELRSGRLSRARLTTYG